MTDSNNLETFFFVVDIILLLEAIMMLTINSLLILIIWRLRKKRTVTHYLIMFLTISDLMLGISLFVTRIMILSSSGVQSEATKWIMLVTLAAYFSSPGCSLFSHLGLALDRWVAVVYPTRYKTKITKKKVGIYFLIAWTYCISAISFCVIYSGLQKTGVNLVTLPLTSILPVYMWYGILAPNMITLLLVTTGLYIKVFWTIRQHKKKIAQSSDSEASNSLNKKAVNVTKIMAILLGIYIVCWGPYSLFSSTIVRSGHAEEWLEICYRLSTIVLFSNSYLNSMLYMYKSSEMRKALNALFDCKSRRSRGRDTTLINVTEASYAF